MSSKEYINGLSKVAKKIQWLKLTFTLYNCVIYYISVYTLSDLADLSNLIGSLSWTI